MQCSNCEFQNMPGSPVCGRCGTSLELNSVRIDVHPPRASGFRKGVRRFLPVRRVAARFRNVMAEGAPSIRRAIDGPVDGALPRLIVPGWTQLFLGQRWQGHLFLWSFLICFLWGLLLFGTGTGSVLLGTAFSIHASAAIDVINQISPERGFRQQMGRSIAVSVVLGGVYLLIAVLLTRVADPQRLQGGMGPFRDGDVLLVNHLLEPRRGRVVIYEIPDYAGDLVEGRGRRTTIYSGERVDRILAGPGDMVEYEHGALTVNGIPSPWSPLDARPLDIAFKLVVPADSFFILPTTSPDLRAGGNPGSWAAMSTVPRRSIVGCVYARSHPLSTMQAIR